MKHTPGPWRAIEQGDANAYAVLANSNRWVIAFSQNGEIWTEEQKANAKLIEAAPELLAALEDLYRHTPDGIPETDEFGKAIKKAEVAINKAKGL